MKKSLLLFLLPFVFYVTVAQQQKIPLPNRQQLAWHDMEFYWFIHFGPNTLQIKNGGTATSQKIYLIQQPWIVDNGRELRNSPVPKGLLLRQSITMVFVYGPASIQVIP